MAPRALFICGSLNQTTIMHKVASRLHEFDCWFTPFYSEGMIHAAYKAGLLEHTILGGSHHQATQDYLLNKQLSVDEGGRRENYDLVVTATDLIVQSNIRSKRLVLIQEGITEPEDLSFWLAKYLGLPRYMANTAATGLSNSYDRFCVASPGYRDLFVRKGAKQEKIIVTGIPNFDNAREALQNDFPYHNYILVATSSIRETGKLDDRRGFLRQIREYAGSRHVIVKLHPNENLRRAEKEVHECIPSALIFRDGDTNQMIANCDVLFAQVSSVVYIGMALGKEVHSYFDLGELRRLQPVQNNGTSDDRIADVCRKLTQIPLKELRRSESSPLSRWFPSRSV